MQVHDITERLVAAALSEDPMAAVRGELELLKTDLDAVAQALSYIPGTGGNALRAARAKGLDHVRRTVTA